MAHIRYAIHGARASPGYLDKPACVSITHDDRDVDRECGCQERGAAWCVLGDISVHSLYERLSDPALRKGADSRWVLVPWE